MSNGPRETGEPGVTALVTATTPAAEHLAVLHARLENADVLDIAYTTVDTARSARCSSQPRPAVRSASGRSGP